MKHDVNDSLINHNADILIQHYPNTMNERWHEGRSIDVIEEKTHHRTTYQTQKSTTFEHIIPIPISLCFTSRIKYPFCLSSLQYKKHRSEVKR